MWPLPAGPIPRECGEQLGWGTRWLGDKVAAEAARRRPHCSKCTDPAKRSRGRAAISEAAIRHLPQNQAAGLLGCGGHMGPAGRAALFSDRAGVLTGILAVMGWGWRTKVAQGEPPQLMLPRSPRLSNRSPKTNGKIHVRRDDCARFSLRQGITLQTLFKLSFLRSRPHQVLIKNKYLKK